jgi:hypothetical protein
MLEEENEDTGSFNQSQEVNLDEERPTRELSSSVTYETSSFPLSKEPKVRLLQDACSLIIFGSRILS